MRSKKSGKIRFKRKLSRKKAEKEKKKMTRVKLLIFILLSIISWSSIAFLIYFVDPETAGSVQLFLFLIFLSLTAAFQLIFSNLRRSAFLSAALTSFLILRYFNIGNIVNFLLLAGLVITAEYFFNNRS